MIKPIMKDIIFLGQKSEQAIKDDLQIVEDLLDTLKANAEGCVGMAANMLAFCTKTGRAEYLLHWI